MIRFVVMLICLLAIQQSVFCQSAFPRKAVIGNDTVCILSIEQVKIVDKVFIDRDECYELRDSLGSQIKNYGILVGQQKEVIASLDKEIEVTNKIVAEKNLILLSDEKLLKKQNRQVKWLRLQRNVLTGVVVVAGGIIVYQKMTK